MAYVSLGQTRVAADSFLAPSLTMAPLTASKMVPSCITAAEKAQAELDCRIPDVKGLGFTYGPQSARFAGMDACAVSRLPVCQSAVPVLTRATTPVRTPSTVTVSAFMPPPPPPPPQVLKPLPADVFKIPPPPQVVPSPPETKKFGLGIGGILLLVAVAGGGAYLVMRKKKGKAA